MIKHKVTIVDYGCGNIFSLVRILEKKCNVRISNIPEVIEKSDKVILPGVGSFQIGINNLKEKNIDQSLKIFLKKGNFLLGICLGMQLLMDQSYEFGHYRGLGLIKGDVKKINYQNQFPIPHIGWNRIYSRTQDNLCPLLNRIKEKAYFYFIHSYKVETLNKMETLYEAKYGKECIPSIINSNNIYGTQFHPEKSSRQGETMVENFLKF